MEFSQSVLSVYHSQPLEHLTVDWGENATTEDDTKQTINSDGEEDNTQHVEEPVPIQTDRSQHSRNPEHSSQHSARSYLKRGVKTYGAH